MPALGAIDPADIVAEARRQLGFSRQLEQEARVAPHPSRGGNAYPRWYRIEQLAKRDNGEPYDASDRSLSRWDDRLEAYRPTGNRARSQIVGDDQFHLICFIIAWPDATQDEMAVFIYNEGGDLYSRETVSKRLKELDITNKRASTEAYQAQRDDVQFRVWCFWNCPLPLGVRGERRFKLIDVDEFGITLEKCNRTGGWAFKVFRVRKDGHYHHGSKITVLFAIEPGHADLAPHVRGSIQNPRRWVRCVRSVGTTTNIFRDFCDHICTDIETNGHNGTDDHRILMWDNLTAHHAAYVHQTVTGRAGPRRFSIIARPQYHPKYAPIEYKICDVTQKVALEKVEDWDMARLEQAIVNAAMTIGPFDSTFHHCGYTTT